MNYGLVFWKSIILHKEGTMTALLHETELGISVIPEEGLRREERVLEVMYPDKYNIEGWCRHHDVACRGYTFLQKLKGCAKKLAETYSAVWLEGVAAYGNEPFVPLDPCKVDDRWGSEKDLEDFIFCAHGHHMRVIMGLVPNHVAKEAVTQENAHLFRRCVRHASDEAAGRCCFALPGTDIRMCHGAYKTHQNAHAYPEADNFTSTAQRDFTQRAAWEDVVKTARYWASLGVDAFRIDMAGHLTPEGYAITWGDDTPGNFLAYLREQLHESHPHVQLIAELYGQQSACDSGFDLLYEPGWLWALTEGVARDGLHRIHEAIARVAKLLDAGGPRPFVFASHHDYGAFHRNCLLNWPGCAVLTWMLPTVRSMQFGTDAGYCFDWKAAGLEPAWESDKKRAIPMQADCQVAWGSSVEYWKWQEIFRRCELAKSYLKGQQRVKVYEHLQHHHAVVGYGLETADTTVVVLANFSPEPQLVSVEGEDFPLKPFGYDLKLAGWN